MPIEVFLFVERFIQLCKDGGWIAIIIPDGILTNSTCIMERVYFWRNTKVGGDSFSSKRRIQACRHISKDKHFVSEKARGMENLNYPVFLACLNKMEEKGLKIISEQYKEFYYEARLKLIEDSL